MQHASENNVRVVVVIRTLNEINFLPLLIATVRRQIAKDVETIIVVVDSGSTDGTLRYAQIHADIVVEIEKVQFTFGRAINLGLKATKSDIAVIVSAHCIPTNNEWLENLIAPIIYGDASASYGRQVAPQSGHVSEANIFAMQYPESSDHHDIDPRFNNANSAFRTAVALPLGFDEDLPGLEDLDFAFRLIRAHHKIAYVANAIVIHLHNEKWAQIVRRFERESRALTAIRQLNPPALIVVCKSFLTSVLRDVSEPNLTMSSFRLRTIVQYRSAQYLGIYRGSRKSGKASVSELDRYFFS